MWLPIFMNYRDVDIKEEKNSLLMIDDIISTLATGITILAFDITLYNGFSNVDNQGGVYPWYTFCIINSCIQRVTHVTYDIISCFIICHEAWTAGEEYNLVLKKYNQNVHNYSILMGVFLVLICRIDAYIFPQSCATAL